MKRLGISTDERYQELTFTFWVNGIEVGYCKLVKSNEIKGYPYYFCCVNIYPAYQGLGYGHEMMQRFTHWCKKHNIKGFHGESVNTPQAHNIYLDAGMKLVGNKIYWPNVPNSEHDWKQNKVNRLPDASPLWKFEYRLHMDT